VIFLSRCNYCPELLAIHRDFVNLILKRDDLRFSAHGQGLYFVYVYKLGGSVELQLKRFN
jgi:hypothetical protein